MPAKATAIELGAGLADDAGAEDMTEWTRRFRKNKKSGKLAADKLKEDEYDKLDDESTAKGQELIAAGLTVGHGLDTMMPGTERILTLRDGGRMINAKGELVEVGDDVLEDTELVEDERRAFNKRAARKFNKYDAEEGDGPLRKYDEDYLDFEKSRKSFKLNAEGEAEGAADSIAAPEGYQRAAVDSEPVQVGTGFIWNKEQSNTFTEEEMRAFRKPKKKRLVRKKTAAEVREMQQELEREKEAEDARMAETRVQRRGEAEEEADALRRLSGRTEASKRVAAEKHAAEAKLDAISKASVAQLSGEAPAEVPTGEGGAVEGFIVLDTLTQFAESMASNAKARQTSEREARAAAAAREDPALVIKNETAKAALVRDIDLAPESSAGTVAGALAALKEARLGDRARVGRAKDATMEVDDDDGFHFQTRTDAQGRELTLKEAFREQARIFHGKSSSTKRVARREKRFGQLMAETRMGQGDTALGASAGLQRAQQQTGQAGIVISAGMNKIGLDVAAGQKRAAGDAGAGDKRRKM